MPPHTLTVQPKDDLEIHISRTFSAPRTLVWDAMTKPEYLRRWMLGPPGWEMTICENDLRPGGEFRWGWRKADGMEMLMRGVNKEVNAPERNVRTETFDVGCVPQMGEQLATMTLTEKGGVTTVTINVLYPSRQARDAMLASGMEHGMNASYARLDAILASAP